MLQRTIFIGDDRSSVMKRQNSGHRDDQHTPLTAWIPVLAAVVIMVTGCVSTLLALQLDAFRPKVGDVVVFRAGSQDSDAWQLDVPATEVAGSADCTLNPNVMATNGGSLVVEARRETSPPLYRLHWAGGHTANGVADCGLAADVTVTRVDLQKLANAAGGFGIGDKGVVR
jgi:hypothetical protein